MYIYFVCIIHLLNRVRPVNRQSVVSLDTNTVLVLTQAIQDKTRKTPLILQSLYKLKETFDTIWALTLNFSVFFSSFEPNAQVSFSYQDLSVTCRLGVGISVGVNFLHFHLFLQNQWSDFNRTWHIASVGKGN